VWFADEDAMVAIRMEKSIKYCFRLFVHGLMEWSSNRGRMERKSFKSIFESVNVDKILARACVTFFAWVPRGMISFSLYMNEGTTWFFFGGSVCTRVRLCHEFYFIFHIF
jgi:hypothetical protein